MAHVTGGGLIDNAPRVLPQGVAARFHSQSWTIPAVFKLIQKRGNVDKQEMYRVFNMGIGMAVFCSPDNLEKFTRVLPEARVIGEVVKQTGKTRVTID